MRVGYNMDYRIEPRPKNLSRWKLHDSLNYYEDIDNEKIVININENNYDCKHLNDLL